MLIFYDCYEIVKTEFKEKDLLDHPGEMVWLICSILWLFAFTEEDYSNLIHLNLCVGFFMIWISRIHDHIVPQEEELMIKDDMILDAEEVRKSNV